MLALSKMYHGFIAGTAHEWMIVRTVSVQLPCELGQSVTLIVTLWTCSFHVQFFAHLLLAQEVRLMNGGEVMQKKKIADGDEFVSNARTWVLRTATDYSYTLNAGFQ